MQTKGERTRAAILDEALKLVSKAGLDDLTIGTLADATGMSKSGLFAHFGSREELLLAVLAHGQNCFTRCVFQAAMARPRGVPRLRAMFTHWLDWTESADLPGGCPMIGGASEFDDKPGPVRDMLAGGQRLWIETLKRTVRQAIEERQLAAATEGSHTGIVLRGALTNTNVRTILPPDEPGNGNDHDEGRAHAGGDSRRRAAHRQ